MDIEADETVAGLFRLAAMQTDPDPHVLLCRPGVRRESALDLQCGGRGRAGCVEDAEELVAPTVDLATPRPLDRATLQFAHLGEDGGVAGVEAFGQTGRVLEVAEEEGERHVFIARLARRPERSSGSSARTSVPRPAGAPRGAGRRASRRGRAARAVRSRPASAVPTPSSATSISAQPFVPSARTRAELAPECLTTFASASEAT